MILSADNEADGVIPQLPSFSPVPSSHSEHDSRASRDSPANRLKDYFSNFIFFHENNLEFNILIPYCSANNTFKGIK